MLVPELTLDAALRDVTSDRDESRWKAVRNLAPALLEAIAKPGPRWQATHEHAQGEAVRRALLGELETGPAVLRGTAAMGLGMLGAPELLPATATWLALTGEDEDEAYLRECAMIATSYLGRAALDAPGGASVRDQVLARIEAALDAEMADLRFQAGVALVELRGAAAEPALVAALRAEQHPEVREGLVEALAYLDPAGPEACAELEAIVVGEDRYASIGFEAAMTLAAARRVSARPRLLEGLRLRHERDRALEALAALGGADPAEIEQVHRLARRIWLPAITRVRAAYALSRMVQPGAGENPGLTILRRLRWHPRGAVREAVEDAFTNLAQLSRRD